MRRSRASADSKKVVSEQQGPRVHVSEKHLTCDVTDFLVPCLFLTPVFHS